MGREIELKIPLNKIQYNQILEAFEGKKNYQNVNILSKPVFIVKTDMYFSRYANDEERNINGEPKVIRIRSEIIEENKKSYLTIKRKKIENGVEFNQEDETFVENPDVLEDLFNFSGYKKYFEKKKESFGVMCCLSDKKDLQFHFELVNVNNLLYAEVECTVEQDDSDEIRKNLEELVKNFELDPKNKDSRSWMKILGVKF